MPMRLTAARLLLLALWACAAAGCKDRGGGGGASSTTAPAKSNPQSPPGFPYEIMARAYAPYTSPDDPLGFPMKVRNLSGNPYRFWRGSKEHFYEWCKANAPAWMGDDGAYLRIHGDLHPGTIGLYRARGGAAGGELAFGPLDFDQAARLPFQLELLQCVVTIELLGRRHKLGLDGSQVDQVVDALLDAYRKALDSDQTATQLLADDAWVAKLIGDGRGAAGGDLATYTSGGRFVPVVLDRTGRTRELLRAPKDRRGFADAIAQALVRTPEATRAFDGDAAAPTGAQVPVVEDVVWRMPFEAAGGEGFRRYLLLVPSPKEPDGKLILYLKQQVPTPAERAGLVPLDPRPPGERSARNMQELASPPAFLNAACTWNNGSYRLGVKEPSGETLDGVAIRSFDDLRHMARVMGTVAGCVHRQGPEVVERVRARLTPEFARQLGQVGIVYSQRAASDFRQFVADPRTREQIGKAEAGLRALESKAP